MAFDDSADLDALFDTDDFAVVAEISDPADEDFDLTINVIFDATTEQVTVYGETNVEAANPQFRCKTSDLATVKRKYIATIASQAYKIERMEAEGDGKTSVVYLSK
jgi:hypothetical protein